VSARVEEHAASVVAHGLTLTTPAWCVVLACDHPGCGALYVTQGDAVDGATLAAAALGWTCDGGDLDGCPLHPVARADEGAEAAPAVAGRGR